MSDNVNEFLKPRIVDIESAGDFRAKVSLEPLERGFGHTLGNALRRILLSSMPGAAITDAQIEGVVHEYTTIEGVHEDVLDILLNLKGVAVRMHSRDEASLALKKEGEGVVTAGDIRSRHRDRQSRSRDRSPAQQRLTRHDAARAQGPRL